MTGALILFVGILVVAQVVVGDAVARVRSYADDAEPANAGARGIAYAPRGGGKLSVSPSARRKAGTEHILEYARQAAAMTGKRYRVSSWYRAGATVKGTNRPSCHRVGKALDQVPLSGNPDDLDDLEGALRSSPNPPQEIIWRGAAGHDIRLTGPSGGWHLHASWECG